MSRKSCNENISISIGTNTPQLTLQYEPKDTKVNIWGYELCNGADWKDFLDVVNKLGKENERLKQQLAEKDKEIEDLKEWQDWYSMWHKKFQKQIENLTTELETYRPTKLHGNGQCECFKCKQEGRQAREWTDWCSRYKGHTYCDDCLKEVLKEEQTPQTQLAIQELEKVKDWLNEPFDEDGCFKIGGDLIDFIEQQINELKGE